jgi:hypothetical protein
MLEIALKDILINARQESMRMHHYYIGVEHLFIGLLDIHGGLIGSLLEAHGLTPEYIKDAIRRRAGKGTRQRMWAGMPYSPRANVVLGIASDLAAEDGRDQISERDLLIAVLEERDSIPARVLRKLHFDLDALAASVRGQTVGSIPPQPYVRVDFSTTFDDTLSDDQLFVLRRMFYGYGRVRIEQTLTGGYTAALVVVVTPIHADGVQDAPAVVKIGHADTILDEGYRYETLVKRSLPPLTARLEEKPTTAEGSELAGLKYTFVADGMQSSPTLQAVVQQYGVEGLGEWLKTSLYPVFGRTWWMQRRPFRFPVWAEYDWLLPPLLTLEHLPEDELPTDGGEVDFVIRDPVKRARAGELEYGAIVAVEEFAVQRVFRGRHMIQLAIGGGGEAARRAYKIEVVGINFERSDFYRGEKIERLVGRVWKNRAEILMHALTALAPDFDPRKETIPGIDGIERLPNPLFAYAELLDRYINGTISTIHGDLHLGNILVGVNGSPFLIDFAQTRAGHTLFDWACFELSLLNNCALPLVDDADTWAGARRVAGWLVMLYQTGRIDATLRGAGVQSVLKLLGNVREIVAECLAAPGQWGEYYVALSLCALRAVTWETLSPPARRLMLLVAALALHELKRVGYIIGSLDTVPDSNRSDGTSQ